jgi:hypothetical protein
MASEWLSRKTPIIAEIRKADIGFLGALAGIDGLAQAACSVRKSKIQRKEIR